MTNVTGATCSVSPSLPTGLSIDSSTCTISGTPTVETSNTTYTVTAVISGTTYQTSVWLSTSPYGTITSAVEGAALNLGEAMTPITLNYTSLGGGSGSGSGSGSNSGTSNGNGTTWNVVDINSGTGGSGGGRDMQILVGDTLYFDAYDGSGTELWAHDTSNASTWRVADINSGTGSSNPGYYMEILVGDTLYFSADDGSCLLYTSPSPRDRTRSRMPSSA